MRRQHGKILTECRLLLASSRRQVLGPNTIQWHDICAGQGPCIRDPDPFIAVDLRAGGPYEAHFTGDTLCSSPKSLLNLANLSFTLYLFLSL